MDRVLLAFLMVIGAGLATSLGAGLVFFRRFVALADRRFLAGAFGLSSGVMLYVSFIEIFYKSVAAFEDAGLTGYEDGGAAYGAATTCFFGGMLLLSLLNRVVHYLHPPPQMMHFPALPYSSQTLGREIAEAEVSEHQPPHPPPSLLHSSAKAQTTLGDVENGEGSGGKRSRGSSSSSSSPTPHSPHPTPSSQPPSTFPSSPSDPSSPRSPRKVVSAGGGWDGEAGSGVEEGSSGVGDEEEVGEGEGMGRRRREEMDAKELERTGVMTAVAIAIHNFPEGIATFAGALADPSVGAALAIAIGIHNIPEGLAVSIPVFYATGSRWKAFGWATLSGISEPIGAALAYAVLFPFLNDLVYAILFGIVAGMMVLIVLAEMLPTAFRFDPSSHIAVATIVTGMAVMALSLVLFAV